MHSGINKERGDLTAFQPTGEVLNSYRNYLIFLARAQRLDRVKPRVDPSDIVQETLLEAHRSLPEFHGEGEAELAGWLRKILARRMVHAVRDHTRQRRDVRRERSLEASLDASSVRLERFLISEAPSPSERASTNERACRLTEAMESLTAEQRQAIIEHYFHGRTVAQVAAAMNRSEAAVGGLLHRGMQMLKRSLSRGADTNRQQGDE
jgi:RNA polymerase sigma-70 factor (ECF subfamily)